MSTFIERATGRLAPAASAAPVADHLLRYALVAVIAWIGALKFTDYEAQLIVPLVESSPLLSWVYGVFSVSAFAALCGVVELTVAALIAVKPLSPLLSLVGSLGAVGLFVTTLTFMVSTPGVMAAEAGGFPVLGSTGQLLIKDLVLLAASLWTAGDALRSLRAPEAVGAGRR